MEKSGAILPHSYRPRNKGDLLVVTLQPCLSRCISHKGNSSGDSNTSTVRWSSRGVSLPNNFSLILLPFLNHTFLSAFSLSKFFNQITVPPPVCLSTSQSLCMSFLPLPCLQSMMKYGCQHDSLFTDCVRIGTLTHT